MPNNKIKTGKNKGRRIINEKGSKTVQTTSSSKPSAPKKQPTKK